MTTMLAHAILSCSGAERWLNCTPSARLEQQMPDKGSEAASEGTLAHKLAELLLREKLKQVNKVAFKKELARIQADDLYNEAMLDHCEDYAVFVMEHYSDAQKNTKDALIFLEQKLNLTEFIPEGFGTGDVVIIADDVLDIIDFKYGKGVPVNATENKQMMLYGLGALREFDYMYDIHRVRMTINQPRLDSISTYEILATDLKIWADQELVPRAKLAFNGEGEFVPGKHCQFCKVRATCKANADMNLEIAKYDFKESPFLTDVEVADILDRAALFYKWLGSVEDYALDQAVNNGKQWPGYKVVEGRSNRKYADEEKVAAKLTGNGFAENIIYTKKLLGLTAMEKEIGKADFQKLLTDLIIKPPGKPALVPESDKRPEYNSTEGAAKDFANN